MTRPSPLRSLPVVLVLLSVALAGCLAQTPSPEPASDPRPPAAPATHVLQNVSEAADELTAPAFDLLGAVARGGPVYGAGEPSIWAHLDGTIYLAFPGCDTGFYLVGLPGQPDCAHGPIYKSVDDGATWTRLNDEQTGRLPGADDAPAANGDNDVTVDADGTIYASNLGGGIQVLRSADGGTTWAFAGDVVPDDHWADRQWMAAAAPGHLVMAWMGGAEPSQRAVAVNTTFDGGRTWTGVEYLGEEIGWLGTVQFAPDGETAYVPFTESTGEGEGLMGFDYGSFALKVARTLDGGRTWDVVDTGVVVETSDAGTHWSGVLMAPALDVTGDGTVVYVYSEEMLDPTGTTSLGTRVSFVASPDLGETWHDPVALSTRANAIMPWVTGGAGDRIMVTWFATDAPADSDYVGGVWDVMAATVDDAGAFGEARPDVATSVVEAAVHAGGLCARGGFCLLTGSDRALLDFFETDALPDGRLVVTYPADLATGGKHIEIRVAVQSGGSPLFAPANG